MIKFLKKHSFFHECQEFMETEEIPEHQQVWWGMGLIGFRLIWGYIINLFVVGLLVLINVITQETFEVPAWDIIFKSAFILWIFTNSLLVLYELIVVSLVLIKNKQ